MSVDITPIIDAAVAIIAEHAEELTALDQAIGDGDHGINMKRGFDAVAELRDELAGMAPGEALGKVGMTLVMKVGGASGPLYGSLFMSLGKALPEEPGAQDVATALAEGVAAVKKRGRSDAGEKTMLDVLVPVSGALQAGLDKGIPPADLLAELAAAAAAGLEATKVMLASKGRASYLGERSIGHLDPGARSSCLLVHTVCAGVEAQL